MTFSIGTNGSSQGKSNGALDKGGEKEMEKSKVGELEKDLGNVLL